MDDATTMAMAASGVRILVVLALEVTLLVLALTVVRRRHPAAVGLFVAAACLGLATTIAMPLLHASLPMMTGGDVSDVVRTSSLVGLLGTVLDATGFGLVLGGIARMAGGPRAAPREDPT